MAKAIERNHATVPIPSPFPFANALSRKHEGITWKVLRKEYEHFPFQVMNLRCWTLLFEGLPLLVSFNHGCSIQPWPHRCCVAQRFPLHYSGLVHTCTHDNRMNGHFSIEPNDLWCAVCPILGHPLLRFPILYIYIYYMYVSHKMAEFGYSNLSSCLILLRRHWPVS